VDRNRIERFVYDLVKYNPRLKRLLRDQYQAFFDLLPIPACTSSYPISVREGYFFGFHDHTPFSFDNNMLLANRYLIELRRPKPSDPLEIGFFSGDDFGLWKSIGETYAWNWHQGCKLQWCGPRPELIYNDFRNGRFISKIYNVDNCEVRELSYPIVSVSSNGRWAVGYSFERVQRYMPGYGYTQSSNELEIERKWTDQSGLYLIDLQSGSKRDLLSVADLIDYYPESESEKMWHYVSHAIFCPSNRRIAFLHRWVTEDTRNRRSRLLTCDLRGENWHLFPTREMVSHLGWRNENQIVAYCRLADGEERYVLFDDQNPEDYEVIGAEVFSSDGHPSFSVDGRWMLTDTYPDRTRRSYLILFDFLSSCRYNLARLHSPRRFATKYPKSHWSCDLHPRFDRLGRYVCFDSTYTGHRALCTIDFGETLLLNESPEALSVICP
jgi:hypothetical protein